TRRPPCPTLFPYTTLFRSHRDGDRRPDPGPRCGPGVRVPAAGRGVTMSWLLRLMLKEEFRVHASYSGQTMFVSFPFIITMFSLRSEEHTSELQSRSDLVCR